MLSYDDALAIVLAQARPARVETVALADAHRRVLARDVLAAIEAPFADVSTMDGYAVRDADAKDALTVVGQSFPGGVVPPASRPGEAWRVFTGGPVPPGTDRVVMQERATRDGDRVEVVFDASTPRFVRARGSDFARGAMLLEAGRKLDGPALIAAAGGDVAELVVWRRPRVAIVTNGDELVAPGTARDRPGSIPESISLGLAALIADGGGLVARTDRLRDDRDTIAARLASADADVAVIVGGASVGERDFAREAFTSLGGALLFAKVAIRPGKPVWFGRVDDMLVLGLPGNPTSAYVTARLFLTPLLSGLSGSDPAAALRWTNAYLTHPVEACDARETFVRAVLDRGEVRPLNDQNSGSQAALAQANVLLRRRPHAPAATAGDSVEVIAL